MLALAKSFGRDSAMIDVSELQSEFQTLYGRTSRVWSAPGRVNLIGEHTDYNDGFVLPLAINRRTFVCAAARTDRLVRVRSRDFDASAELSLDDVDSSAKVDWVKYIFGVARVLQERGIEIAGADLLIASSVPVGAGLSSSAALEISVGAALVGISGKTVDLKQLALAGQAAEHRFVGTRSGIMDQFVAALGVEGHALLIDCRALEAKPIPLKLKDYTVVVCDTKVEHNLAASEYNKRRAECERAVEILRGSLPEITHLRDVSTADLKRYESLLPKPLDRRARHVVTENERTLAASNALKSGDVKTLGGLMNESHRSLRDDYEVSCAELDLMCEIALSIEGVAGARMTGGGFGGCTINLVRANATDLFQNTVAQDYEKKTGIAPEIYLVEASAGVREETSFDSRLTAS